MNAFYKFSNPQSEEPNDWGEAVETYCTQLSGVEPNLVQVEIRQVLAVVRAAVSSQKVRFRPGEVPEAMGFANRILTAMRRVDLTVTAWSAPDLVPTAVRLFVQPTDDDRFDFYPMFTL